MNILDPLSGKTVVIDFAEEREKRRLSLAARNRVPRPYPILTKEWDDEALQPVDTIHIDRDPGDER
jgi:hypothetical protein